MKGTAVERFHAKYIPEPNSGCWLWDAGMSSEGYGSFSVDGRTVKAHRFSYEAHNGPIPKGMLVCHKCDVPACVNPAHLFLGTDADNMADRDAKGRHWSKTKPETARRGERSSTAKLTETTVREIRGVYAAGGVTMAALGARYGIVAPQVHRIVHGQRWAHVV